MIPLEDRSVTALLDQGTIWRSWGDDGRLVEQLLDDMGTRHRESVLGWLRDHAQQLRDRRADHITHLHKAAMLTDRQWADALAALDAQGPEMWLEEQPLVRRLAALVPRQPLPARGLLRRRLGARWRR